MAAFFPVCGRCLCPRAVPAQRWVTGGSFRFSPRARPPSAQVLVISQKYRAGAAGRRPHPWPQGGFLSDAWTWVVWGDRRAEKAGDFTGGGAQAESRWAREPRPTALRGPRGPVLRAALLPQGPPRGCAQCSAKMDASEEDSGRWKDMGAPRGLCLNSLVGDGLVILCSFPGLPVSKELKQMISMVPPGWAVPSVYFP